MAMVRRWLYHLVVSQLVACAAMYKLTPQYVVSYDQVSKTWTTLTAHWINTKGWWNWEGCKGFSPSPLLPFNLHTSPPLPHFKMCSAIPVDASLATYKTDRQAPMQVDKQTDRQAEWQTDSWQAGRQTNWWTDRYKYNKLEVHKKIFLFPGQL